MIVSLIAAVPANGAIGKDNQLIWDLPKDMKFFMDSTMNHNIIMGRKNFESIPEKYRPLRNRTNIIVTRNTNYKADNCFVTHSIKSAINIANQNDESECFIIGGGEIYRQSLENELVDRMYITHIKSSFEGDTFFPKVDWTKWKKRNLFSHSSDLENPHDFDVVCYEK